MPSADGDVVRNAINAIRFLSVDAVQKANSGHPGAPMGLAPLAYRLYTKHLRHDPADPDWPDRDRFVLSAGHASMLLYSTLHLAGYGLTIGDLEQFRQYGSKTPGHPERHDAPGVEVTTGPLGQGLAMSVGVALAEAMLAGQFNRDGLDIVNHRTWVIASDGDMMEGVAAEAASLAGFHGLDRLTVFYDDNRISLSGPTSMAMSENVGARFDAYGWHVVRVEDVNDLDAIDTAVGEAVAETRRPTLVLVRSHIGFGSPVQDTSKAHGSPLGPENVAAAREALDWPYAPFEVPDDVYEHWRTLVDERAAAHADWDQTLSRYRDARPELADEFDRRLAGDLPEGWAVGLPEWKPDDKAIATRKAGHTALNALAERLPELAGGSADLDPSTLTFIDSSPIFHRGDEPPYGPNPEKEQTCAPDGRNLEFGVRELAMAAATNGIAADGGLRPYCATFFTFSDYMRNAIRLAALMRLRSVFVFTHDSIGLGEDGPTHQPIEQLAGLRAVPDLRVIRPADPNETMQAWVEAIAHDGPTVLVLTRQSVPTLDPGLVDVAAGASIVADGTDVVIVGTGSEVGVALDARALLADEGVSARVVSMPCWEIFRARPANERNAVLAPELPAVGVEAGSPLGWAEWVDAVVALDRFGASAPAEVVFEELGITPVAVAAKVRALLAARDG